MISTNPREEARGEVRGLARLGRTTLTLYSCGTITTLTLSASTTHTHAHIREHMKRNMKASQSKVKKYKYAPSLANSAA